MSVPNPFFPDNVQQLLNNMNPAAARARLGDIIVELQAKAAGSGDSDLAAIVNDLAGTVSNLQTQAGDFETRIAALEALQAGG